MVVVVADYQVVLHDNDELVLPLPIPDCAAVDLDEAVELEAEAETETETETEAEGDDVLLRDWGRRSVAQGIGCAIARLPTRRTSD